MLKIKLCKNETYQKDLKTLLKFGYKIFLNRKYDNGINRHVFYKTQNTRGHHFYHVKYILNDNEEVIDLKDYPAVTIPHGFDDKLENIINETTDKIMNFIKVNAYEVSCDRKE